MFHMQTSPESTWNTLEIAKLAVSVLTPAAIAILGIYIHRVTKRFEDSQWKSQKLIEKRIAIYDDLAPEFNDLLCYFTFVGCWKDLTPSDVVSLKRKIDKRAYLAAPLFPSSFFRACDQFQNLCFSTYGGWGTDARLRTKYEGRKEICKEWLSSWDAYFSDDEDVADPEKIRIAYREIMQEFAQAIGVEEAAHPPTGSVPGNIR